jgi:hypothetical protein
MAAAIATFTGAGSAVRAADALGAFLLGANQVEDHKTQNHGDQAED